MKQSKPGTTETKEKARDFSAMQKNPKKEQTRHREIHFSKEMGKVLTFGCMSGKTAAWKSS